MRTPRMEQDSSQSTPLNGLQPNSQEPSGARRKGSSTLRDQTGSDKESQRSRASSAAKSDLNSETSRYNRARGPINEAVHSALDPIDPNHTTLSPELLNQITSQITATVLEKLKASQLTPQTSHSNPKPNDHMDSTSSHGDSPPIDRDKVYTPPSPYRASEEAAQTGSPTSPRKASKTQPAPQVKRPPSPPFSQGTLSEESDTKESVTATTGPRRPDRGSTGGDATILERIWGELFDEKGRSTPRLSQFLRGVAVHLIEDYEPKHSLVITPDKMQKYYEVTRLSAEVYPWHIVFDDRTSSISRLFREIEVQHHLVQDRLNERPDIPGMTPIGFETWMTLVLKAHPEQEFERLAYTALHMPVSNPDDRKERFPKELSRRQFPKESDNSTVTKLQQILHTHCGVKIPVRSGSMSEKDENAVHSNARKGSVSVPSHITIPKPAPFDNPLSQTTTRSSVPEIDRNSLRATVSEVAVDDSPIEIIPPPQIERERKPYVANPGGGKHYDNLDAQVLQPAESKQNYPAPPPPSKLTRSSSLNNGRSLDPKLRPPPISIHQKPVQMPAPAEIPPLSRQRTGSNYTRDGPGRGDRNRSPSKSRNNEIPHKSDEGVSYGSFYPPNSGEYTPTSRRPENRYEHRPSVSIEPRERDREPRQRYNSVSTGDGHRYHSSKDYTSEEEYRRPSNAGYVASDMQYSSSQQHYPPNSYPRRT